MKKLIYISLFLVLVLIAVMFYYTLNSSSQSEIIESVNTEKFEQLIESGDVFVLNTHTPYIGEIEGTDLIAENWQNIASYKDHLPKDKNKPILVYCRSSRMSESAAQQLKKIGYRKIYNLKGGINAWKESGRKVVLRREIPFN